MNHYRGDPTILVEDLINSHDLFLDEPEHLKTPDDLKAFLVNHGFILSNALTQVDLEAVHKLRGQLREIWTAATQGRAVRGLNGLLAKLPVIVQFAEESPDITLRVASQGSLVEQVAVQCVLGMVRLMHEHGFDRMQSCAASPCRDVFVDMSRNKSRRFCSDRCANRYNIAAYRERQRRAEDS